MFDSERCILCDFPDCVHARQFFSRHETIIVECTCKNLVIVKVKEEGGRPVCISYEQRTDCEGSDS